MATKPVPPPSPPSTCACDTQTAPEVTPGAAMHSPKMPGDQFASAASVTAGVHAPSGSVVITASPPSSSVRTVRS